jgi:hypothetical protein
MTSPTAGLRQGDRGIPSDAGGEAGDETGMSTADASQFLAASSRAIQNATVLESISRASRRECFMQITALILARE